MTPDLDRLRGALVRLDHIVDRLELELVVDPRWGEPSDTSYLNDNDRANPDIMANVEAMAATNDLVAWFGRDDQGFVGLWRGPSDRPIETAPVVRLDTEGQYSLLAATVPDYLAIAMPEEEFGTTRQSLIDVGFAVASSPIAVRRALAQVVEFNDSPNVYRHALYNQGRARRGLTPI